MNSWNLSWLPLPLWWPTAALVSAALVLAAVFWLWRRAQAQTGSTAPRQIALGFALFVRRVYFVGLFGVVHDFAGQLRGALRNQTGVTGGKPRQKSHRFHINLVRGVHILRLAHGPFFFQN